MLQQNILGRYTCAQDTLLLRNTRTRGSRARHHRILAEKQHLSICTNKTCKKQGSQQIAKFAQDLNLKDLEVETTGCLAKCGNGPNMVLSPLNVTLSHVNTIAKMKEVLQTVAGLDVPESLVKATELRLAGNGEARSGNLEKAARLYTSALELHPPYGRHLLLSNRSGVLLSLGRAEEAARDADEAAEIAPEGFRNAFVRQVEAHCALNNYKAAASALEQAAKQDPAFAGTKDYQALSKHLGASRQ